MDGTAQDTEFMKLTGPDELPAERYGARAEKLNRLARLGIPVPEGVVLPGHRVALMRRSGDAPELRGCLPGGTLLCVRLSPPDPAWGGAAAILNVGMCDAMLAPLSKRIGRAGALQVYRRFIQNFGISVAGLDPEEFENLTYEQMRLAGAETPDRMGLEHLGKLVAQSKEYFADEAGRPFPENRQRQLAECMLALAKSWDKPSARILRCARGAPDDAETAMIVQKTVLGIGDGIFGTGVVQLVSEASGLPVLAGSFLPQSQGLDAVMGIRAPRLLGRDEREAAGQITPSLEEICPSAVVRLRDIGVRVARELGDEMQFEFTLEYGELWILDMMPARRSARAAVQIAVGLAEEGAIGREDALLRIDPRNLIEHLHPQIDPAAHRNVAGRGLAASPGAASGQIAFSAEQAQAMQAQGGSPILVRAETSPEDIRGMHAATGVLTVRGGMTSHAAVIARGLGLPCIVGAGDLTLDARSGTLTMATGEALHSGDTLTLDGTRGEVLIGTPPMVQPELGGAFAILMDWADDARDMGVRVNADTPQDARLARRFKVDGIGLCRTEHMFLEEDRITVMREMILADTEADRRRALERLMPMQRQDFEELFQIMRGMPVTIRLLDPPLHEFLPHSLEEMKDLADAMDIPVSQVVGRAEELSEFNPMLGKRGVRLGVTMPEIYEMQARAIFEAAVAVNAKGGDPVVPEIMIPLVSANREVELVKQRVDAVAATIAEETRTVPEYKLGVMVETPRAALRAGDLAASSAFLSFGTNDLTQMTYGLSRDDAGRFMRDYVAKGVYPEDPFHSLDLEGVGELMLIAARRGRESNPDLVLGLCGEHGGDPASVRFCKLAGFDYVSCSAFRVPIARLAAAQATI
ncbi:MAG: pyruvate, phosphate dikinase, partial [Paracoccaceae bacterium]